MKAMKRPTSKEGNPIINWEQKLFEAVYSDIEVPGSEIPDNAVRRAFNMLLYGDWAEVRPGTALYSSISQPSLPGRTDYQATKTGDIITKTVGDDFTPEDVDNYFVWPVSGRRDLIIAYNNGDQVQVKWDTVESAATAANPGSVQGPENAKRFWHKSSRTLFAFIDTRIFRTDWQMTGWAEVPLRSSIAALDTPLSSYSVYDEYKSFVYLINPNGVFVIDTRTNPLEAWKANTTIPDNDITEVAEGGANVFGRRYLTALARLTGTGNRDRTTTGVRVQQQSGTNVIDQDNDGQDYAEVYGVAPGAGNRNIGPITMPAGQRHWTHIPIYGTRDLEVATHNEDRYTWMADIPVIKAFDAYRDNATGAIHISAGGNGIFEEADADNPVQFADGTVDNLGDYVSATQMGGSGVLVAVGGQGMTLGAARTMTARQDNNVITREAGDNFLPTDVGNMSFWADGGYSFIVEYYGPTQVRVDVSAVRTSQGMGMEPNNRYFSDTITDNALRNRSVLFNLFNRFWTPLPLIGTGVVTSGFIFVNPSGIDEIHYSQLPLGLEYLGGYYNEYYQIHPVKDSITALREFRDRLVIYCDSSVRWAPTNVTLSQQIPQIGEYITVITGINVADAEIGVKDIGSIVKLPDGKECVITSEPGVRIFNGRTFSQNFALDRAGRSYVLRELQALQAAVASGYDEKLGYIIFGSDLPPDN